MECAEWAKILKVLPSKVEEILSKGNLIYEMQCLLFKSLTYSVAYYVERWIGSFEELTKLQSIAALGNELIGVLHEGMEILQLCASEICPGVLFIVLGSLSAFHEIIDDARRYSHMINDLLICHYQQFAKIFHELEHRDDQIEYKIKLLNQIKAKIELDCSIFQEFLQRAYEKDKHVLISNLQSGLRRNLSNFDLISMLETRVIPAIACTDLVFGQKLGNGTFGKVFEGKWHNHLIAVKEFKVESNEISSFDDEIKVFSTIMGIGSSHIVQLLGHSEREKNGVKRKCLVLEFMTTDLKKLIMKNKINTLLQSVDIILQIAKAMKHLHHLGVIYRDMKPNNILVRERDVQNLLIKIADFGASKINFGPGSHTKMQGTNLYMAPEVLEEKSNYTMKVDVFSFGVVCSEILTGNMVKERRDELKKKVVELDLPMALKNLIVDCWENDPDKRPTFTQICEALWLIKEQLLIQKFGIEVPKHQIELRPTFIRRATQMFDPKLFNHNKDYLVKNLPIDQISDVIFLCLEIQSSGRLQVIDPRTTLSRPFIDGDGVDPQNEPFTCSPQNLGIIGQFKKLLIDQGKRFNLSLGIKLIGKGPSDHTLILDFLKVYPIFNGIYFDGITEDAGDALNLVEQLRKALPGFMIELHCSFTQWPIGRLSVSLFNDFYIQFRETS